MMKDVQVGMDIDVEEDKAEDKDEDRDEDLANASRCSTPLTPVTSDMDDFDSDPEDVIVEEVAVTHVDVTPKGKQRAKSTPKGKKPVSRRTPKGKGNQKAGAEEGADSAFIAGSEEEGARSEVLQPPAMSPAFEPSPSDGVITLLDINQQVEFSPHGVSTRFTRSSRRREASIVPKSEIVVRDVTPVIEDQQSSRRSGRRVAPAEGAKAVSSSTPMGSPAQAIVQPTPRQSDNQKVAGPDTEGIYKASNKAKRSSSSRWHQMVPEYRQADGTWRPVNAEATQDTVDPTAEDENRYITQSGRIVKRRDPSVAPKEVSTTSSGRAEHANRVFAEPVDKPTSSTRPRTTASKPKPSKPDHNQARSSGTTRRADPPRHRSATVGTQHNLPAARTGYPTVGYETTPDAPLGQAVVSEHNPIAGPDDSSPLALSYTDRSRRTDRGRIPTPIASQSIAEPIAKDTARASSTTKGKRVIPNLKGVKLPGQPLTNGTGSRRTVGTGQPAAMRPNATSAAMQLQELRESQNVVDTEFHEERQRIASGFQAIATGIQTLAAELQAMFARNQAMLERMDQTSLAQQERISKMEKQYFSQIDSIDTLIPPRGVRLKVGIATTKSREPTQKHGPGKKKGDKPFENDPEFPCMSRGNPVSLLARS